MPHSTTSLDSLSSPSPSPPPSKGINPGRDPATVGLDSDSELSELTEEEQEAEKHDNAHDEDDDDGGRQQRPRRGRRKRGSIVPAPMWEWATRATQNAGGEDKEDMAGLPRPMEEEEDDADDDDSAVDEKEVGPPRTKAEDDDEDDDDDSVVEEEEEEEMAGPPTAMEEEEDEDDDDDSVAGTRRANEDEDEDEDESHILAAAAAASSIMAGSTVLRPPSPSPSSSASDSIASSRSPSPALGCPPGGGPGLPDGDATGRTKHDHKPKQISPDKRADMPPPTSGKVASISPKTMRDHADVEVAELDGEAEDVEVDDPSPDHDLEMELESDLQPAHRAEALDVLATIELKFALLRERVYVEKMDALAWEEALVGEGTHPELIHLHAELLKRRDKRLDLATRKRAYEVTMATKRRRVDEAATWNWWKFSRDELQTDMISETNRKRRKLERERRAMERPQPVRRIPRSQYDLPVPPTFRKIIKAFPLTSKPHNKRDSFTLNASPLVYPELSPLAAHDIDIDLKYLFQHQHRRTADMHRMGNAPNGVNLNTQMGGPPSYDPAYMNGGSGLDPLGPPPAFGLGNRMPPPPLFQHPLPLMPGSQQTMTGFAPFGGLGPGRPNHQPHPPPSSLNLHHNHNPQSHFMLEHDMGSLASGPSHLHLNPPPPYFGAAQGGTGGGQMGPGYPSQGGHVDMRRSISPVPVLVNGPGGSGAPPMAGGKQNGGWVGLPGFHNGIKHPGALGEWIPVGDRSMTEMEDDERDLRARESRRERERNRERDREREREQHEDRDRERERGYHHMPHFTQQPQHRSHPLQHQHLHAPAGQPPHHHAPHHHHHHHHHHVLHHHHGQQHPAAGGATGHPSSGPLPSSGPSLSPRVVTSRDFEPGRSHSGLARPTEVINLSSSKPGIPPHWKAEDPHSSAADYREPRGKHNRPSSGPPVEDRERPLAMPFVMASTHSIPPNPPPAAGIASGSSSLPRSPRGSWGTVDETSFRRPSSSGSVPVGYLGSAESHGNSPAPHRFGGPSSSGHLGRGVSRQNSLGHSPPHARPLPPLSPPSSSYPVSRRSPTRFGPPPPPPSQLPPLSHALSSPNLKHRPMSPTLSKLSMSGGPSVFSPRASGPVHISPPTSIGPPLDLKSSGSTGTTATAFTVSSRTASPHMFPSPSTHPSLPPPRPSLASNGSAPSPRVQPLPPPKMNIAQMVDGL